MSLFSDPKKNIDALGIVPGQIIADFGSGSGRHTLEAASALASNGRVFAIDVQKELLTRLSQEAQEKNLSTIDVVWGDVEKIGGTKLKDGLVDIVIMSNILFQLDDKKTTLLEAKRILKPGGRVMVVDWNDSFGGIGPMKNRLLPKESCEDIFTQAGFALDHEFSTGSHHYGLIFKKL